MTETELRDRWITSHGIQLRTVVLKALRHRENWESVVKDLAGRSETGPLADLRGIVLSDSMLGAAELNHASLDYACFDRCDLTGGVFSNSSLRNCSFRHARLVKANFVEVVAHGACFDFADLTSAHAMSADFKNASFRHAILDSAALSRTCCIHADFSHAQMRRADLSYANFSYSKLTNADLTDVETIDLTLDNIDIFWEL